MCDNKAMDKLELISSLLSAPELENERFQNLKSLIYNDFMDFANSESSLKEEAKAVLQLESALKRLELALSFSNIFNKNIVAIGGGFSAGKSEFMSSLFKSNEIKLPIGIQPVTAISSYVVFGTKNSIRGYTKKGTSVAISESLYQKISHDFVKSFDFNLKDIMPAMEITTPLEYEHICFIDTPGYNPSDISDGFTSEDINTSKEFLEKANALLWLVGLDSNGTIPKSDLEFLSELDLEGKQLYIIANKADLKAEEDIEDVLDEIEEILDEEEFNYVGISAYSSVNLEEVEFRKCGLHNFLKKNGSSKKSVG